MEILASIWNVLTTENELITKIIISPAVIIEDWIIFSLIVYILKIKYTSKQKYTYVFSLSIISIITNFTIPSPYNVILNFLIMFLLIKKMFNLNIIYSVLCTIIPTAIFALVGSLILKPILLLNNISIEQISNIPIYRLCYLIVLYLLTYLFIILLKYIKLSINLIENFETESRNVIIFHSLFGIFTICIQLVLTAFYTDVLPFIITFLNFISLFAYFFISFFSLTRTLKLQITAKNLESAENYNNTLSYLYDNVKAFQHDFNNMVFIMGGFIQDNDIEGLKKYYKSLEKDCNKVNNIALLNPTLINNSGIYNLLMSKYKKASFDNVTIHLEYFFDLNKLNMPIYDFSRILGILLDNAIEAAKETKDKQVNIMFRDSSRNHTQIINIENTYLNKNIDTKKIFEKGESSKEKHSGIGLWEVKQILNKNSNVNLITTNSEIYFKQSLEIYY